MGGEAITAALSCAALLAQITGDPAAPTTTHGPPAARAGCTPPPLFLAQSLAADLAAAVDAPFPEAREQAARELAARPDVSIADWLAAMESFGSFEPAPSGESVTTVRLQVASEVEATELWVYVPAGYRPGEPAPLMMVFHGTGGSGRGMTALWREAADELGMLVLAPSEAGPNEGYAWSERERAAALAALRWMRRSYNVDENRVYASGISRGGHLAWDLALRHPGTLAAIAPLIGGPRLSLRLGQANLRYVENVVHTPIRDLQGAKDDPGLVFNVRLAFEKLHELGAEDAELHEFPELGHWFDFEAVDWVAFLQSARRDPREATVVRACARAGEGRAYWIEALETDETVEEVFTPRISVSAAKRLDDDGRRAFFVKEAEKRTGRLEVTRRVPGRFTAKREGVGRFRILLTEEDFEPGRTVLVKIGGRNVRRDPQPAAVVLLREFVERFDRSFLPVAELVID